MAGDRVGADDEVGEQAASKKESTTAAPWIDVSTRAREAMNELLTETFLADHYGPVSYHITNPWKMPPLRTNMDWLVSSASRHCVVGLDRSLNTTDAC